MGIEPTTLPSLSTAKPAIDEAGGVKAALGETAGGDCDPEMVELVTAWPELPADVRKMILGVARLTLNQRPGVVKEC